MYDLMVEEMAWLVNALEDAVELAAEGVEFTSDEYGQEWHMVPELRRLDRIAKEATGRA